MQRTKGRGGTWGSNCSNWLWYRVRKEAGKGKGGQMGGSQVLVAARTAGAEEWKEWPRRGGAGLCPAVIPDKEEVWDLEAWKYLRQTIDELWTGRHLAGFKKPSLTVTRSGPARRGQGELQAICLRGLAHWHPLGTVSRPSRLGTPWCTFRGGHWVAVSRGAQRSDCPTSPP